jgi:hypothetical protein
LRKTKDKSPNLLGGTTSSMKKLRLALAKSFSPVQTNPLNLPFPKKITNLQELLKGRVLRVNTLDKDQSTATRRKDTIKMNSHMMKSTPLTLPNSYITMIQKIKRMTCLRPNSTLNSKKEST